MARLGWEHRSSLRFGARGGVAGYVRAAQAPVEIAEAEPGMELDLAGTGKF